MGFHGQVQYHLFTGIMRAPGQAFGMGGVGQESEGYRAGQGQRLFTRLQLVSHIIDDNGDNRFRLGFTLGGAYRREREQQSRQEQNSPETAQTGIGLQYHLSLSSQQIESL
jgi:hypothetical protein